MYTGKLWTLYNGVFSGSRRLVINGVLKANVIRNFSSKNPKPKGRILLRSKRFLTNLGIAAVLSYTGYAVWVIGASSEEIAMRQDIVHFMEEGQESNEGTLVKYSPLKVLGRFENPFDEYRIQTVQEFFFNRIVELFQRNRGGIPNNKEDMDELMPIHKPDWLQKGIRLVYEKSENKVVVSKILEGNEVQNRNIGFQGNKNIPIYTTWLGQSCNYILYNGLKILTDPLFSDYLVDETFGPKRITEQPCQIDEVPEPDVIVVSHNHPDHLDAASIEKWRNTDVLWIVPKGMSHYLKRFDVSNFIELSWWETCELEKGNEIYHISCTPAMHWSGRGLTDINHSLWCSFLLSHNNEPILFHAGDTGYVSDLYSRIKRKFGSGCRLAILPCGQYCPEWHQKPRHIDPSEVIKIMEDLEAKHVLGVHWGTFVLSGEYFREPKERLELLAEWKGIKDNCHCPELGKTEHIK
ncbi:hypothetical protein Kpol_242p7 [Vanderwaltozyma polyspora DSM 70294]|uniref:Metallo-beta-lactamase domain-containing protein n=1 Tax=Vanderwaltozyma polyspora (strain ATCC 22028 / DSM 70294 / BCRC 21397 / CBS 2163 / NBRC 10782 / NRRL Y-8283 / UCD 57-17) TaxID=436907 RepID=A7TTC7_VANPO|nr:uncharacterized protein Kpol_242p7 [Vanderwaltozyma polyspora DSM 70294]EDO14484.1 hypothetical protein Kpol_242p7 [Vanderwaltozyma polyspora DSM 70294]